MGRLGQALSGVAGSVRRRPVRAAALSVGLAVAAVVALPLSLEGCTGTPRAAMAGTPTPERLVSPPKLVPAPWSALTLNGRPPNDANGQTAEPWFDVTAGETVTFAVTITVPAHAEMKKLFLGISVNGTSTGVGPRGPVGMAAVLATASHLTAGAHRFTVNWTVPDGTPPNLGYQVAGAAYWPRGTKDEPDAEEGPMATVFVQPGQKLGSRASDGTHYLVPPDALRSTAPPNRIRLLANWTQGRIGAPGKEERGHVNAQWLVRLGMDVDVDGMAERRPSAAHRPPGCHDRRRGDLGARFRFSRNTGHT